MINVIARVVAPEYWENVADNLSKAGWGWGCVSAIDSNGRTVWMRTRTATMESVSSFTRMRVAVCNSMAV
jgi:hypothetical protein